MDGAVTRALASKNVARVRFPDATSHVGWGSSLLQEGIFFGLSSSLQKPTLQILIRSPCTYTLYIISSKLFRVTWVNKLHLHFFGKNTVRFPYFNIFQVILSTSSYHLNVYKAHLQFLLHDFFPIATHSFKTAFNHAMLRDPRRLAVTAVTAVWLPKTLSKDFKHYFSRLTIELFRMYRARNSGYPFVCAHTYLTLSLVATFEMVAVLRICYSSWPLLHNERDQSVLRNALSCRLRKAGGIHFQVGKIYDFSNRSTILTNNLVKKYTELGKELFQDQPSSRSVINSLRLDSVIFQNVLRFL